MESLNTDLTAVIILELTNKLKDNEMCHDPVLDDSVNLVMPSIPVFWSYWERYIINVIPREKPKKPSTIDF